MNTHDSLTTDSAGPLRIALLFYGTSDAKKDPALAQGEFRILYEHLAELGAVAQPVLYRDEVHDAVREQLLECDAVQVWVNPIEGGRDRSRLDGLLRELSNHGVFVSTHPESIQKLGTKQVLYDTRETAFGCETYLYRSMDDLRRELPSRLDAGLPRVLKQYRGNGGNGVWKIERSPTKPGQVRVHHAKRGCVAEDIPLEEFFTRCTEYFNGEGRMVDQAWQPRLPEGMVRCYLVGDRVEGFGHQAVVALHPSQPQTSPRIYHPATKPEFQSLKQQLETQWLPEVQRLLEIETAALPLLWDCDFMLGPRDSAGRDSHVLCEINVSCVSPFPESAARPLARVLVQNADDARRRVARQRGALLADLAENVSSQKTRPHS